MKKLILSVCAALTLVLTSCGPSQDDAIKYNDQLIATQKSLLPAQDAFIGQIDGHNVDSLKLVHEQFKAKAKTALEECEKMTPFNGKREYLDAGIEYFKVLKSLADNEAKDITEIMSKDSTQVTEKDIERVKACAAKFDSDYGKVLKKAQDAQAVFSKEWNFDIRPEEK